MKTIKANYPQDIPEYYTGIIEWQDKVKFWFKTGIYHREDGPAIIWSNGCKEWRLHGTKIWNSNYNKISLKECIILSKEKHSEYPACQLWKYIDENGIRKLFVIPGMEECITE